MHDSSQTQMKKKITGRVCEFFMTQHRGINQALDSPNENNGGTVQEAECSSGNENMLRACRNGCLLNISIEYVAEEITHCLNQFDSQTAHFQLKRIHFMSVHVHARMQLLFLRVELSFIAKQLFLENIWECSIFLCACFSGQSGFRQTQSRTFLMSLWFRFRWCKRRPHLKLSKSCSYSRQALKALQNQCRRMRNLEDCLLFMQERRRQQFTGAKRCVPACMHGWLFLRDLRLRSVGSATLWVLVCQTEDWFASWFFY